MSLLDGILSQVSNHPDVGNLARQVGLSPTQTEQAIAALGVAHQAPGDTLALASGKTGLDTGVLSQIVSQIGGEGSLGEFARMLSEHPEAAGLLAKLDKDGDGSVVDDIVDMAKGLFNKS
jgi:hypothetical protein